ncbi:MAG: TIGR00730 family Rossman fold protein [Neisseriales bacterium]|nr:MAG: TIGR00730 family Rossman fold protein [Neisseriales bacterium]
MKLQTICVFCGSNHGVDIAYEMAAKALARTLVQSQRKLVYGGGKIGLMGVMADTVIELSGHITGVIPHILVDKEQAHPKLSQLEIVANMHERKARMMALSDAFIALPGGLGTFEELFEILSWSQIGLHQKPCGVLNVNGFFDPLLSLLQANIAAGFMRKKHSDLLISHSTPEELLMALEHYHPPQVVKWLPRGKSDIAA